MSELTPHRRKSRHHLALGLLLALCFGAGQASASMLLFEQSGLLTGSQTVVRPIDLPGAGTLQITLTDLAWPTRLESLSFALSNAAQVLTVMNAPGTQTFFATGSPGQLFAHVHGSGAGPLDAGLFSLRVEFTPVPLPTAAVLLLTGLGLVAAVRRPRTPAPAPAAA